MIPILDLTQQYRSIKAEIDAAISGVLESGSFIMGAQVKAFEAEIASYLGVKHAIAMNSGTDALHLALRALGIGPGDEVITSPFTFVATTEAIGIVGATPVFADINPQTFNISPAGIERALTKRTKAIIPIHLYGLPADMPEIMKIADAARVAVVEDCAQSVGADINGVMTGKFGKIGCFSFFPSKNLGAYGDGGMACTDDAEAAERLRSLRIHGGAVKYHHDELGVNSRLDEIQAAVLRVKLRHLAGWTENRRRVARRYRDRFDAVGIASQADASGHVYHQYTVRLKNRDGARERLSAQGIQTMIYYPVPLHLQPVHSHMNLKHGAFPHSEQAADEVLSLPMYPELTTASQDEVIEKVVALSSPSPAAVA